MSDASDYFTPTEEATLLTLNVTMASASMLGSLFIIGCYVKFPNLRNFAFKLVFLMSICDVFRGVGHLLGDGGGAFDDSNSARCQIQAFLKVFFGIASLCWSSLIALSLHMAFLRESENWSPNNIERYNVKFHAVTWSLSLLLALLPIFFGSYGQAACTHTPT